MPTTKLISARIRKTKSKAFPISIETPAIPVAPKTIATSAKTKNASAARNIQKPPDKKIHEMRTCSQTFNSSKYLQRKGQAEAGLNFNKGQITALVGIIATQCVQDRQERTLTDS
jgi:hypothetical protein